MGEDRPSRGFRIFHVAILLMVAAGAWGFVYVKKILPAAEANKNFDIGYKLPEGWVARAHTPQTLFLYVDPKTDIQVRGAESQVISDENPTPELDRDGLAHYYAETTRTNMPGWTAKTLDVVDARGTSFRLLQREGDHRNVVTAFAVRGNTTLMVSMAGVGPKAASVNTTLPDFRRFLHTISFARR